MKIFAARRWWNPLWQLNFSDRAYREWYDRIPREWQWPQKDPLPAFILRCFWIMAFIHFAIFTIVAETGVDGLEPAAISVFWAPILAAITTQQDCTYPLTRFGFWVRRNGPACFWGAWAINAILIPALFWEHFRYFDLHVAHPLRECIGKALGLGGQTGLLLAICAVLGIAAALELRAELALCRKRNNRHR